MSVIVSLPAVTCPHCQHRWFPRQLRVTTCPRCRRQLVNGRQQTQKALGRQQPPQEGPKQ
jgi:hypothetical protein